MKAAKEHLAPEVPVAVTPATAEAVAAAVTGRHPTLNTKPLFKLMVVKSKTTPPGNKSVLSKMTSSSFVLGPE